MKNKGKIRDTFATAGQLRVDLNSIWWKKMNKIQRLFVALYGIPLKQASGLNQFYHYKNGGYPNEDSPPRYKAAAEKLAYMFLGAECIGEEHLINEYLEKEFGIKLTRTSAKPPLKLKKFNARIEKLFVESGVPAVLKKLTDPKKLFKKLLCEMDAIQVKICQMSDTIKYVHFSKVKKQLNNENYKKGSFFKGVAAEAASIRSATKGKIKKESLIDEAQIIKDILQ